MKLRWYQEQAVNAILDYLRTNKDGAPCVVLPTGSGKTPVLAELCRLVVGWKGRVCVLAHVKELLVQNSTRIRDFIDDETVGVYSAGLNERVTDKPVIVAGIQSVYKRAEELGPFNLIIVDEAHLVPTEGTGRYRTFIEEAKRVSPQCRLVGLTATPWRLGAGWITKGHGDFNEDDETKLFDEIVYEVPVKDLIADGTLSAVVSRNARKAPDFSDVHIKGGEYAEDEVEKVLSRKNVLESACAEIYEETKARNRVLVFCNRVESAKRCANLLSDLDADHDVAVIDGTTPASGRARILEQFKSGSTQADLLGGETKPLKYVCNVGVLTTGFDAPNIDAVVILRPTNSLSLYHQIVGRGLRRCDDKSDCLILDYGGNVDRLGPIDLPRVADNFREEPDKKPWKTCQECFSVVALNYAVCPICGSPFPKKEVDENKKLTFKANRNAIVSDLTLTQTESVIDDTFEVEDVTYEAHYKKDDDTKPPTFQITYNVKGRFRPFREWLCPEHKSGWARRKFEMFWREKSTVAPPTSAETCAYYAKNGALAKPAKIRVFQKGSDNFPTIFWQDVSPIPRFDPTAIEPQKTPEEEFDTFSEFDSFAETNNEVQTCNGTCGSCSKFSIEDHLGEDAVHGFCSVECVLVQATQKSCSKYQYNESLSDVPF